VFVLPDAPIPAPAAVDVMKISSQLIESRNAEIQDARILPAILHESRRANIMEDVTAWYKKAKLADACTIETHCIDCDPDGICDICDTVEGVYAGSNTLAGLGNTPLGLNGVFAYAGTCDGPCMELTENQALSMDPHTQLGYCDSCLAEIDPEIRQRIEAFIEAGEPEEMINCDPLSAV
jgi:hypothetical protein